ncbi:hypothetical protein E2493_06135 [Sphingomonas parva]|uniref:Uncharacterized protein n=1 Tax=Sphingomonas parva TaxID=2555898 RepID=A0A4Y8ZUW3_9SPHN|nr:hypothetical protein [Sphingomonas parva]TFI59102.1 hypothetical protein E2493_06135 [Sphingomonas parva]
MNELSDAQRVERAARARRAIEEFLAPALGRAHETFSARLKDICAREPWAADRIAALANAIRILEELGKDLEAAIHDGDAAAQALLRAEKYERLTPARRRLLGIGPF